MDLPINKIICGKAEDVLPTLPAGSVNCCISSPPYWALRDYGVEGQLGLEPTFEEYIDKLCGIYDEVKRVLRKDGTCWVNLGDTYGGTKVGNTETRKYAGVVTDSFTKSGGVEKSLCLIPQRFAIEMVSRDTMDIYELDKGFIVCNNVSVTENKTGVDYAIQRPRKSKAVQHGISTEVESGTQGPIQEANGRVEKKEQGQDKSVQPEILRDTSRTRDNSSNEGKCKATPKTEAGRDDSLWWKSSEVCLLWGGQIPIYDDRPHQRERKQAPKRNKKYRLDLRVVKENELSRRLQGFVYELQLGTGEIWILPPSRGRNLCLRKRDIPTGLMPLFKLKKAERWILRNVLIWHKPNPMPSSAKDRFTVDFEYVYFFVKNNNILWHYRPDGKVSDKQPDYKNGIEDLDWQWGTRKGKPIKISLWQGFKYWFETQYEPLLAESKRRAMRGNSAENKYAAGTERPPGVHANTMSQPREFKGYERMEEAINAGETPLSPLGRNKRTVWTIPTQPFPEAHFATYPEKLVEPMIKAGCPEFICTKCGKARERIIDTSYDLAGGKGNEKYGDNTPNDGSHCGPQGMKHGRANAIRIPIGYTDCNCGEGWRPGIVLDPFAGACTTLKVAANLRRNYIGIELSQEYIDKIAIPRLAAVETGVPVKEQKQGQKGLFDG